MNKWDIFGCIMLLTSVLVPYLVIRIYKTYGVAMPSVGEGSEDLKVAYTLLCVVAIISSIALNVVGWIVILNNL